MYAFAQRSDTRVVDEPLYAHYLHVSGADHPGRDEVLASQSSNSQTVIQQIILGPVDRPVLFMKQMAHHLVDLDLAFLEKTRNVILIRDPREMLPSLINQIPSPTLRDTGLKRQSELYDHLVSLGQKPPVLDARETLLNPEAVLRVLCDNLGIPFEAGMLTWPPEPRPEDGIWAQHWYHNVQRSTGFAPYKPKAEPFPEAQAALLEACEPYYHRLESHAIKAIDPE